MMQVEPVILIMMRLLTRPGGAWSFIFGEGADPAAGIILAGVTVVAVAVQLWLICRTARRGGQTMEDSEAAVDVYLPVCLHGDPRFSIIDPLPMMNPGKPARSKLTTSTTTSNECEQRNYGYGSQ